MEQSNNKLHTHQHLSTPNTNKQTTTTTTTTAPAVLAQATNAKKQAATTAPTTIRSIVLDCLQKNLHTTATFYADKLVTLTQCDPSSVLLLGRCFYLRGEYKRVIHLLKEHDLIHHDLNTLYLAAQAQVECKEWEECLILMGEDEDRFKKLLETEAPPHLPQEISIASAICVLRGRVYESLENRKRAIIWYKEALKHDTKCHEAFERLIEKRMLKPEEERKLFSELRFPPEMDWLRLIYKSKLEQHDGSSNNVVETLKCLESEYRMSENLDVLCGIAEHYYLKNEFHQCFRISKAIVDRDPYHHGVLPVHICCMVELGMKSELFYCAHQLVHAYAQKPISWFSVGCYYYCIRKYDIARRYFSKSTTLDQQFCPGWIGFGHCFAMQDESDQAMSAYRTAGRLFEGSHLPLLCIGIEYLRTNNLNLAKQFFVQSHACCPTDPLIYNELGVVAFKNNELEEAVKYFLQALSLCSRDALESWEPTLYNLGHSFRKLHKFPEARKYYNLALGVAPRNASIHSALGFTHHLEGNIDLAVECYHKALGLQPRDTFTSDLLATALHELFS